MTVDDQIIKADKLIDDYNFKIMELQKQIDKWKLEKNEGYYKVGMFCKRYQVCEVGKIETIKEVDGNLLLNVKFINPYGIATLSLYAIHIHIVEYSKEEFEELKLKVEKSTEERNVYRGKIEESELDCRKLFDFLPE